MEAKLMKVDLNIYARKHIEQCRIAWAPTLKIKHGSRGELHMRGIAE